MSTASLKKQPARRKEAVHEAMISHDTATAPSSDGLLAAESFGALLQDAKRSVLEGKTLHLHPNDFDIFRRFFSRKEIEELVVPKRTLARRNANDVPLTADETDKAVRLARIAIEADRTFGNSEKAARWLRVENRALAGKAPIELLATETGSRIVEELLGQIEHGMFI